MTDSSMETITAKQQQIADLLSTSKIPGCMSEVIGEFIITVQDLMPPEMRNSTEWKRLLPLAAGTGRKCESERIALVMQWMWETVLPTIQPFADENGFGTEWRVMLQQRTTPAATLATARATVAAAAYASRADDAAATAYASRVDDAAVAAAAAADSTVAAAAAADSTVAASRATLAYVAAFAASRAATADAADADAWRQFNPCDLLERLIAVS